MRIGLLGTGKVATTLATGLLSAGHEVVLGSREPRRARDTSLPVVTLSQAAGFGDVVVNAVSGRASLEVLNQIGAPVLSCKIIMDVALAVTTNRDLVYPNFSLAETIQQAFPQTRVVKTLNTVAAELMADPGQLSGPSVVFLSGNDVEAKQVVGELLSALGWPTESQIDLGDIATARGPEHLVPLLLALFGSMGTTRLNLDVVR
jgi:predicted dinucleotide-binding enzyme